MFFLRPHVDDWVILDIHDADNFCYKAKEAQLKIKDCFYLSGPLLKRLIYQSKEPCRVAVLHQKSISAACIHHIMTKTLASKQTAEAEYICGRGP